MKKILINITNGFSLRFLCHTDILKKILEEKNIKVFILSKDAASTRLNLGYKNIEYVEFDESKSHNYKFASRFYNFLETIRLYINGGDFKTPEIYFFYNVNNKKLFYRTLIFFFKKIKFLRKILVFMQSFYYPKDLFKLISQINPDLVITSSLGTFSYDEYILRISKKLKIKTCACILSWDNSTTRGYPRAIPDKIFSWTEIMKKELVNFSDIDPNIITVSGVPHFDNYYNKNKFNKKDFLKKINLPTDKKIILIITKGPSTFQFNPNICDLVSKAISTKKIDNAHIIVRIHPLFYQIDKNKEIEFQSALDVFNEIKKKYNCLTINYPNITSNNINFEMHFEEQHFLKNLILSSDLIINIYSTVNIEGAILDRPLINIDFDNFKPMYEWSKKYKRQNLSIDRNLDHNLRIMRYGGISNVKSEKDLINEINNYLSNPERKKNERKVIAVKEGGPYKGSSGRNIAHQIINFL